MNRLFLIAGLTAASIAAGSLLGGAQAAPMGGAQVAGLDVAATNPATPVNHRHYWGHRGGSVFYFGSPFYSSNYYGRRCWWSHRRHHRVCTWY